MVAWVALDVNTKWLGQPGKECIILLVGQAKASASIIPLSLSLLLFVVCLFVWLFGWLVGWLVVCLFVCLLVCLFVVVGGGV
jgi:hypothetical protein